MSKERTLCRMGEAIAHPSHQNPMTALSFLRPSGSAHPAKQFLYGVVWSLGMMVNVHAHGLIDAPDLPPLESVKAALLNHPEVRAARSGITAGEATQRRISAGSHETTLRLLGQQRTIREDQNHRFGEWDVTLERPVRLPGKAAIDERLGAGEAERMRTLYGDALHEGGRGLLKAWFGWAREDAVARQWREQGALLREQLAIVEKRVRAGDAPRLETGLAEAALAGAESGRHQAELKARLATNTLTQSYAGIPLPETLPSIAPQAVEGDAAGWRAAILEHNHELAVARRETALAKLHGERARAELTPDPAFGVRAASERGGAERLVGLSFSIPFAGPARNARSDEAAAQAAAAEQREAAILRKIALEADNTLATAQAAWQGWQSAGLAAERMRANADLLGRAYALGEAPLGEVLAARRLALEAGLSATLARLDAAESRYRLLLDAHQLWAFDEEGE
jgi:outer membrane protein, heavy metal efflux system